MGVYGAGKRWNDVGLVWASVGFGESELGWGGMRKVIEGGAYWIGVLRSKTSQCN